MSSASEESVKCRGVNGSINLRADRMQITGGEFGSTQPRDIPFDDVSAIVVERKSVVPFATVLVLTVVVIVVAEYNLVWFLVDLSRYEDLITSGGILIVAVCAIMILLRMAFVNVSVRSTEQPAASTLRLVPIHCAKRLARRFRELSTGS